MLGAIFEDFLLGVNLIYKDKLWDNYSIFNEKHPTKLSVSSNKKTAEDSVLKGLNYEAVISLNTTNSGLS